MSSQYTLRGRDSGATGVEYVIWDAASPTTPYPDSPPYGGPIVDVVVIRDRGVSGGSSPGTTEGDMSYFDGTTDVRLGIGSNNQVLASNGTIPGWVAAITPLKPASAASGDLWYYNGTGYSRVGIGSAGKALIVNGLGVAPSWGNIDLTSAVTGILPVANGGTGVSSLTLPGSGLLVGTTDTQTLTNKTINGSNNTITNVSLSTGVTGTLSGASVSAATTSAAGTMSAADKTKLDGIQQQSGSVSISASAIDWSLGQTFYKTLSAGATTFTFSNSTDGWAIQVVLTGAMSTVTWLAGIKWPAGAAPTQTSAGTDIYTFLNRGGTIYGFYAQAFA